MSEQRFDLTYTGLVAPGADPEQARQRLSAVFKLSEKGAARLFTGRPVVVRRDVDTATAARFRKIFGQAGALLIITPVEAAAIADDDAADEDSAGVTPDSAEHRGDPLPLALAPPEGDLEPRPVIAPPPLDTSYLSLVPGDGWTLEDCEAPPTPIPEPDTSYLSLAPPDTDDQTQQPIADWIHASR